MVDGPPSAAIIKVAADEQADLVVVGRRGRGGFSELLLGSVSHQLAHHVGRPLVIVP
jgi:nucleotide-binding universal stress UspA family protein